MTSERKREGWLGYTRVNCLYGDTFDYCMTDAADNPNSESKSPIHLNSFQSWVRIDGGKWVKCRGGVVGYLQYLELFTPKEVLQLMIDERKVMSGHL